jgi:hypothetical protein
MHSNHTRLKKGSELPAVTASCSKQSQSFKSNQIAVINYCNLSRIQSQPLIVDRTVDITTALTQLVHIIMFPKKALETRSCKLVMKEFQRVNM